LWIPLKKGIGAEEQGEDRDTLRITLLYNRVFRIVRKTQHQNPEFGPKPGDIKKKPAKKYISLQQGGETQTCTISFVVN
jgi:hypothetical protein